MRRDDSGNSGLARLSGAMNPYAELIPPDMGTSTDIQMNHAKQMDMPAVVSLNGGIGDHLEVISMLLEWSRMDMHPPILNVSPQREQIFSPLIASCPQLELQSRVDQPSVPVMAMREWICRHCGSIPYGTWIENKVDGQRVTRQFVLLESKGEDNPLSAHLRSVPIPLVLNYYKTMRHFGSAADLIDVSDWNLKETTALKELGVRCLNPRNLGLSGLINFCKDKQIITIDTALAHICAVMGKSHNFTFNHIPDERWVELHRTQNCYGRHLKIIRQTQFCNWEDAIESLLSCTVI